MPTDQMIVRIDRFFRQFPSHALKKGDVLIRAGDEPKGIYYLKNGHVRQYVITTEGQEMTLNIYKPGAFFPMSWAINEFRNTYYFDAMDSAEVWVAPKQDVLSFIQSEPDVMFDLLRRLYSGLDGILSRMEHLMSGDAAKRLMTVLIISAKRFGEIEKNNIVIRLKLTHQDLASLAGLSRETVSREMMDLKHKNLIDYTNTIITIQNIKELETFLL